ncbi:MAG: hypothetical protein D3909_17185, partial [Candidatus Electrothrix sp. ATG1]|nr:hypothetical protein [Candidatus Electrothrix sp. ATG1]
GGGGVAELRKRAKIAQRRYAALVEQFEAEQKRRKRSEQIQVLEKPVKPLAPIKPKKIPALLAAFVLGLISSIAYGVIQVLRDRTTIN